MNTDSPIFVGQSLNIYFNVTDQDDNVVDITGASMSFVLRAKGEAKKIRTPVIVDGPSGQLKYTTVAADLDVAGDYEAQAEITIDSNLYLTTIENFSVLDVI